MTKLAASFVIATYNRGYCICSAIDSVLETFNNHAIAVETIVVDDFSTDKTEYIIRNKYAVELQKGILKYIKLEVNRGVSGARNVGASTARSSWLIFLDSDDVLINNSGPQVANELNKYVDKPIVFFRCIDQNGQRVGTAYSEESQLINLKEFLQYGSKGESLVAFSKTIFTQTPFEEELRGYEGLTIARILKKTGESAVLSFVIARKYIQTGDDRLSSGAGFAVRLHLIARGHRLMVREFAKIMPFRVAFFYIVKSFAYEITYYKNKMLDRVIK